MIDYDTGLRKGYYDVLVGLVSINGSVIPVVDEKLDTQLTEHDIYIKLTTQNVVQQNNKSYFAASVDLSIDIVQLTLSVGGKLTVDDVADQIYNLLFPTKNTITVILPGPLKLTNAYLQNSTTDPMRETPKGFITIKTLTFFNRIIQDA
jgi:hypothetical protein